MPSSDYIAVLGDLNIDFLSVSISNPIYELMDTFGFLQVIHEPTRISKTSSSLLDPIFISADILLSSGTLDADNVSDHRVTYCNIQVPVGKHVQKFVSFRDFKCFNEDEFFDDLFAVPWNDIYYMAEIDDKVEFFTSQLSLLFKKHIPLRTVRVSKPPAPWLTPALKIMMKERDKALLKYKKNNTPQNWENYRGLRNFTLLSVRREKTGYLEFLERQKNEKKKNFGKD